MLFLEKKMYFVKVVEAPGDILNKKKLDTSMISQQMLDHCLPKKSCTSLGITVNCLKL
jgi:hypothetical protein